MSDSLTIMQSLRTIGLVDSGSTTTFIPMELADMLSIPVEKQAQAVGAGGQFQNTIRKVNITILKGTNPIVHFNNFPAYVPTEADRIPYVVLGRDSLFRKFDVTFREDNKEFFSNHQRTSRSRALQLADDFLHEKKQSATLQNLSTGYIKGVYFFMSGWPVLVQVLVDPLNKGGIEKK
jgi:hypothetical protein